jgi:hypothetical protein
MLNNPVGSNDLVSALGQDRVLLGFPGAAQSAAFVPGNWRSHVDVDTADRDVRRS